MPSKPAKKRIGSPLVRVRLPPDQLAEIQAWIARQPQPRPSVPQALRVLAGRQIACEDRKNKTAR